jgi:O-methyltransferase
MHPSKIAANLLNRALRPVGAEIRALSARPPTDEFPDLEPWVAAILEKVRPLTMTSEERISALCHAARYVARSKIPGDIVECGVWRGGSMMAAAMTLLSERDSARTLHLFDTFEGMTRPAAIDRAAVTGEAATALFEMHGKLADGWAYAPLDAVRANLAETGYPRERIRFIKGKVEDTIPPEAPEQIAILRLDTDWYESTRHELAHLFPRLVVGGVLIIDDYGHWEGARKAVDEYFAEKNLRMLLQRIDYTGRLAVKMEP